MVMTTLQKKVSFIFVLLATVLATQIVAQTNGAHDYNGNNLKPNKIIFNNKSTNSYIQSVMQKTVNFDGLTDSGFGSSGTNYIPFSIGNLTAPTTTLSYLGVTTSIAIDGNGNILLGGTVINRFYNSFFSLTRLTPSGALDTTFNEAGENGALPGTMYIPFSISDSNSITDQCNSIAVDTDGNIFMGGVTLHNGSNTYFAIAKVNSS